MSDVAFSPIGDRFAVKNTQGSVAVVDLESALVRLVLPGDAYGEGAGVRFSPDGRQSVDGSWQGDLLVRDATTGATVVHERCPAVGVIAPTPDGRVWVYDRGDALAVRHWPFEGNQPQVYPFDGRLHVTGIAAASPDRVAIAATGSVEIWRLDGRRRDVLARWETAVNGTGDHVAWSPDGRHLVHAGAHYATLLDADLRVLWHAPFEYASDVAFSPDGRLLAVGDWSKGIVVPLHGILT